MKVGVVSDSHGNLGYLKQAAKKLIEEEAKLVIHLGDDYDDTQAVEELPIELVKIPGVFSHYYKDPRIPNRLIKEFTGWKVLITHSPTAHENDLPTDRKPEDIVAEEGIDVVLHGHTHIPRIEEKNEVLWINPGHLKTEDKKGYPPSFALIDFDENQVKARIIDLAKGEEILTKIFSKG